MKLIDLSMTMENGFPSDPVPAMPQIIYESHDDNAKAMASLVGPEFKPENLPTKTGYANEKIIASGHSTTHVDAPWHYSPIMNNDEKAWTIDEVPIEWFYGDGVVVDFSDKPDGYRITPEDFDEAFKKINYALKEGDIVLVISGAQRNWGKMEYLASGVGMGKAATLYLLEKGVRVCGTDAWGWDPPFKYMAEEYNRTGDSSQIWGGHLAGVHKAYCHIEKLANLDKLPPYGFKVCCFPIKIKGGSAGWTRAVAMLND